jgi:hypothetical protein
MARVVETGVARGVSTRVILEALKDRPDGILWSVDLPLLSASWAPLFATAIPEQARQRWRYVRGPTRRVLPRLLAEVGPLDLFVQDTRSTLATAGFEFGTAWLALRPGGLLVANSIDRSLAFARFVERERPPFAFAATFERKPGLFGVSARPAAAPQAT